MSEPLSMSIVALCHWLAHLCDDSTWGPEPVCVAVEAALKAEHPHYGLSSFAPLTIATDAGWFASYGYDTRPGYVFCFGAYGATLVAAEGDLCDALEGAAATLPRGHFHEVEWSTCPHCGEGLPDEVLEDLGDCPDCPRCGETLSHEDYEADLTLTESGYLISYEWAYCLEYDDVWGLVAWQLERQGS